MTWTIRISGIARQLHWVPFLIAPFFVLAVMTMLWNAQVRSLTTALSLDRAAILTSSEISTVPQSRGAEPEPQKTSSVGTAPIPRRSSTLTNGRFEWMTFHLMALVLYPFVALLALYILCTNLGRWAFPTVGVVALLAGQGISSILLREGGISEESASLMVPTKSLALAQFDRDFESLVWDGMRFDYGLIITLIVLLPIAGAAILSGTGPGAHISTVSLNRKRAHLKILILAASFVLSFNTVYWGEWLAWPARFLENAETVGYAGSADEFRSYANGLRLYFGTAYSLALLAFAIPAVLKLSWRRADAAGGSTAPQQEPEPYLGQVIFTRAEIGTLLTTIGPFTSAILASALQL